MNEFVIDLENIVTLNRVLYSGQLTESEEIDVRCQILRAIKAYDQKWDLRFDVSASVQEWRKQQD
jgi:hypothetical protein